MDAPVLLIADSNPDFRQALARALEDRYRVYCCGSGYEALELLQTLHPRILVLDLVLPELDGFGILQAVSYRPRILATTPIVTPYVLETAQTIGIDYVMRKPCQIQAVTARIRDLSRLEAPDLLETLGFSQKHNGTRCLPPAIEQAIRDPGQSMTKELYPAVGKLLDPQVPGCRVEKWIRYAIGKAWQNRDPALWRCYFPKGTHPTNREFILRMAAELKKSRWE